MWGIDKNMMGLGGGTHPGKRKCYNTIQSSKCVQVGRRARLTGDMNKGLGTNSPIPKYNALYSYFGNKIENSERDLWRKSDNRSRE